MGGLTEEGCEEGRIGQRVGVCVGETETENERERESVFVSFSRESRSEGGVCVRETEADSEGESEGERRDVTRIHPRKQTETHVY